MGKILRGTVMVKLTFHSIFLSAILLCFAYPCIASAEQDDPLQGHHAKLELGESKIFVVFDNETLLARKNIILPWVARAAESVANYFGQFPVPQVNIALIGGRGRSVHSGVVFGGDSPVINIRLGNRVDEQALKSDWVLVHEMAHLAFPEVGFRWIEEGMATYVESIARASMGDLSSNTVWREFIKRMPQGQPARGDKGLDRTPTWGRTYWGGAIFCLVADVEIRRRTNNQFGLQDAFKGILAADLNIRHKRSLAEVFSLADKAVGVPVLSELYSRHRHQPTPFALEQLWKDLGIELSGRTVTYSSSAPLSTVRQAILPN